MSLVATPADWQRTLADLDFPTQLFIDGKFASSASGRTLPCVSPDLGDRAVRSRRRGTPGDIDRAVASARRAFDSGAWSLASPRERKQTLLCPRVLLTAHQDELALLMTADMGKATLGDSPFRDRFGRGATREYFAEAIDKVRERWPATPAKALGYVTREPIESWVPWSRGTTRSSCQPGSSRPPSQPATA